MCHLLYLGDGDSEDSPKCAVITIDSTGEHHLVAGREIGRIKHRELSKEQLQELICKMNSGHYESEIPVQVQVEPKWHHSCEY